MNKRYLPALLLPLVSSAGADTPVGWIASDFPSAYTQDARTLEVSAQAIRVDDTIDFLDIRDELVAGDRRLVDNSGDLDGWQGSLRVGVFDMFSVFYQRQEQDLALKLGEINSLEVRDIDQALETTREEAGLKWTFYQAGLANPNGEITAASLELAWLRNETEDFDLSFDSIRYNSGGISGSINFSETQTASVRDLKDDGWRLRFLYSRPLLSNMVGSAWIGYSQHEASSGTGTTVPLNFLNQALTQRFEVEEDYIHLGFSLNWQILPRLPFQLSYEYINIHDQRIRTEQAAPSDILSLPGFLSAANLSRDDGNHTLSGSINWWLTPDVHIGMTGKLFSNQFLGVIPHYNNPLSASFSDEAYGYLGLRVGVKLF